MINDRKLSKTLFKEKSFSYREEHSNSTQSDHKSVYKSFIDQNGGEYTYRRKLVHKSFMVMLNSDYLNTVGAKMLHDHIFPVIDQYCAQRKDLVIGDIFGYGVFTMNFASMFGAYLKIPDQQSAEYKFLSFALSKKSLSLSVLLQNVFKSKVMRLLFTITSPLNQETYDLTDVHPIIQRWVNAFQDAYINTDVGENECECDERTNVNHVQPYVTSMLMEMRKNQKVSIHDIVGDVAILFGTGVGTTNKALSRSIIFAGKYPSAQQHVFRELKAMKEKYGKFELKHVSKMHYLRAFVYECLRNAHIVFGVPRTVKDEGVTVGAFNVPKGCMVTSYYGGMDHDPKHWKYSHEFDLRNFLDEHGRFHKNDVSVFGHGIRSCPGQSLAQRELLLFLGLILLRYEISVPTDSGGQGYQSPNWYRLDNSVYDTKLKFVIRHNH